MAKSTWKVTNRSQTITENITLVPEGFGGWYAQNIGDTDVEINGFVLEPNAKLDAFSQLPPDCVWNTPIIIVFPEGGTGKLRITRLQYTRNDE